MRQPSNVRCYLPESDTLRGVGVVGTDPKWPGGVALPGGYDGLDDFARSIDEAYRVIRERMANGGPGWTQKP